MGEVFRIILLLKSIALLKFIIHQTLVVLRYDRSATSAVPLIKSISQVLRRKYYFLNIRESLKCLMITRPLHKPKIFSSKLKFSLKEILLRLDSTQLFLLQKCSCCSWAGLKEIGLTGEGDKSGIIK